MILKHHKLLARKTEHNDKKIQTLAPNTTLSKIYADLYRTCRIYSITCIAISGRVNVIKNVQSAYQKRAVLKDYFKLIH